jgi:hypothetical protein
MLGPEIAIEKLKTYKLASNDQSLAEMIQTGSETVLSEIQKFVTSI